MTGMDAKYTQAEAAINNMGPEATAKVLVKLMEKAGPSIQPFEFFHIPQHPYSVNHHYNARGSDFVRRPEYTAWRKRAALAVTAQLVPDSRIDYSKPLHVDIYARYLHNYDVDNFIKSAIDACQDGIPGFNDKYLRTVTISGDNRYTKETGEVLLRFRNLTPNESENKVRDGYVEYAAYRAVRT